MATIYRVLVAIDLKAGESRLLMEVQRQAKALKARVDVIHVATPDPEFVGYIKHGQHEQKTQEDLIRDVQARLLKRQHRKTQAVGKSLCSRGVRVDDVLTVQGPPLATILAHVKKLKSDLLILGSRHHGALYRLWYGDTATGAVHRASCAVLVVPAK